MAYIFFSIKDTVKRENEKLDTFLYFSYGSNMLSHRIHLNNPSAKFVSIARLDDYRLDFIRYSRFWGGPTATLVPTANSHVWGVIWSLDICHIETLDEQEGVNRKIYYPNHIQVLSSYMGVFKCRVYIQKLNPLPRGDSDDIPIERWPSWTYKEIIILGAMEHEMPGYYIRQLEKLKNNGERGCFKMYSFLLQYATEKPCSCKLRKKMEKPQILDLRKIRD